MNSIKHLIFLICILTICFSCFEDGLERFQKECPYELKLIGHYLHVPITVSPNKLNYKVGDTITISTIFSDSIYDLATQQTFKIEEFPFKPKTLLYRFVNQDSIDSGYRVNESYVDEKYDPKYTYTTNYADSYRGKAIYENETYYFELQLILKEPGRYIMLFSDQYFDSNASANFEANAEADAINFEGKCPSLGYYICSIIEQENNLGSFERELLYLDEEVYRGNLASIESYNTGPLGTGGIRLEWSGFYGFNVSE